jgi:hypothetical protein
VAIQRHPLPPTRRPPLEVMMGWLLARKAKA